MSQQAVAQHMKKLQAEAFAPAGSSIVPFSAQEIRPKPVRIQAKEPSVCEIAAFRRLSLLPALLPAPDLEFQGSHNRGKPVHPLVKL